ncbi:ARF GTPase-activating protein GIT2-like [Oscarella lobularis]|uniref:ARF GTPase-activating protein GIT2-like n=1 Tax=Oscarella lobularis TaxID=121494 RepID=UPI00331358DD
MASHTCSVVCADCSAPDPKWALINKGVLVCDDCCSAHRLLGRHISDVRSLTKSLWPPTLLEMITSLASKGANSIWEHTLMDPDQAAKNDKTKPRPDDPVHPTKFNFVVAKYKNMAFVHRLPVREDDRLAMEDLSKQLHASVRSSNLETCLRLLFLGAQVNYFHAERGNCPLHVAASAGQSLQVELLVCYGADPCKLDSRGHTPVECARIAGYHELADRLIECQYELTDRLTFYVCGRRPDHSSGEHYAVPSIEGKQLDYIEGQNKLRQLKNSLFERLAADVYDEVDRRETDAVWLATQNHSKLVSDHHTMPFLPVNPTISSTRNQGRQKLATFTAKEFAVLICDILVDAKRRQALSQEKGKTEGTAVPMDIVENDDWDHDYDEVPEIPYIEKKERKEDVCQSQSEDDLDEKEEEDSPNIEKEEKASSMTLELSEKKTNAVTNSQAVSNSVKAKNSPSPPTKQASDRIVSMKEHLEIRRKLEAAQAQIKQLTQVNENMTKELKHLQSVNATLRQKQRTTSSSSPIPPPLQPPPKRPPGAVSYNRSTTAPVGQLRVTPPVVAVERDECDGRPEKIVEEDEMEHNTKLKPNQTPPQQPKSLFREPKANFDDEAPALPVKKRSIIIQEAPPPDLSPASVTAVSQAKNTYHPSNRQSSPVTPSFPPSALTEREREKFRERKVSLPAVRTTTRQTDVVQQTERITKRIQELLLAAQHGQQSNFVPCSRRISAAVKDMVALFPQRPESESIRASLRLLASSATRLLEECKAVPSAGGGGGAAGASGGEEADNVACLTQQVIQSAYDIAKAAKQLVTHVGEL